uniref:Elongin-C n=1 Tax=Setaria italica TaxID=4555 RepID=K4AGQ1_SETIT
MMGKGEAPAPREPEEEEEDTGGVVKLISAEGFEFVVDKKAAMVSNTLRNMLTSPGGFSETRQGEVRFPEISTHVLEKICQYFYWSLHYSRLHPDSLATCLCSIASLACLCASLQFTTCMID